MQDYSLHYYLKIDSFAPKTFFVKHLLVDASDSVLSSFANQMDNDISLEECLLKTHTNLDNQSSKTYV